MPTQHYALIVLSQGAEWQGCTIREHGQLMRMGHRKKVNVAEPLPTRSSGAACREIVSDLTTTCIRRSDLLTSLSTDLRQHSLHSILDGKSGLVRDGDGCYELVPIPDPNLGRRKLDVATTTTPIRYRPMYATSRDARFLKSDSNAIEGVAKQLLAF